MRRAHLERGERHHHAAAHDSRGDVDTNPRPVPDGPPGDGVTASSGDP